MAWWVPVLWPFADLMLVDAPVSFPIRSSQNSSTDSEPRADNKAARQGLLHILLPQTQSQKCNIYIYIIWIYLNPPCPLLSAFTPKSPNPTIHSILYILWHPLPLRYGFYLHVHGHPAAVIYQVRVASLNEGGIHSFVALNPLALYHRLAARATKKNLVGFQTTNYRFNPV